ncbi:hypothetical protein ACWDSJ_18345 [Nocardia sp. NPDC003482]
MEFGSRARRVALGCCVAVTVIGSLAVPAPAAPPPAELPPDLVSALRRDLRIDAAQYLQRIRTAERLDAFARTARAAHPRAFAGVRMDGDRGVVALAEDVTTAPARAAAEREGFAVESVADSEATLRGRRVAFEQWLTRQPRDVAGRVVSYGIDVTHNSLTVRVTEGTTLPEEAGRVRAIAAAMPVARPQESDGSDIAEPGPGVTESLPDPHPAPGTTEPQPGTHPDPGVTESQPAPHREPGVSEPLPEGTGAAAVLGGQPYAFDYAGRTGKCSFGFNGVDAAGNTVNITAGHCDPDNLIDPGERGTGPQHIFETAFDAHDKRRGAALGWFEVSELGPQDYSVIRIDENAAPRFRNNLVTSRRVTVPGPLPGGSAAGAHLPTSSTEGEAGKPPSGDVAITGTADPVVGGVVCKAGLRTGYTCGQVLDVDMELNVKESPDDDHVTRLRHMFAANVCGQHGDSGGPVFAGASAVGISSAVAMDVTSPEDGCGLLPLLIGQPINAVLQANPGLRIRTS